MRPPTNLLTLEDRGIVVADPALATQVLLHVDFWKDCERCSIGTWAKEHVFVSGQLPCDILFIGEGPGRTENRVGRPFAGKAGLELSRWIDVARSNTPNQWSYALTNTVSCRPCDTRWGSNRVPSTHEIENCSSRLSKTVELASPRGIVLCGQSPMKALLNLTLMKQIPHVSVIHPAALLHGAPADRADQAIEQIIRLVESINKSGG